MTIITRFGKNDIIFFSGFFYRILETDRIRQKFDNSGVQFATGANSYEIKEIEPTKGKLTHIDKIGINGYIEIQLYYPERTPRGAVKGAQRINYQVAPHQNPYKYIFFAIESVPPFLDINNPKSYAINSEIFFYGWYYVIKNLGQERPRDPVTQAYLPFTDITNFVPYSPNVRGG